ncbi:SNF2 family N-terminal domain-containing protein [Lipomyces oligophaga]|uniref:SNF2 family N-terminal domain-containing protein n=1 Tax=Lipomyces oligophaga TaxID=45792 RepID=UPI0034CF4E3B
MNRKNVAKLGPVLAGTGTILRAIVTEVDFVSWYMKVILVVNTDSLSRFAIMMKAREVGLNAQECPISDRLLQPLYSNASRPTNLFGGGELIDLDLYNGNSGFGPFSGASVSKAPGENRDPLLNAKLGRTEKDLAELVKARQPSSINTKMLDYQLQGLAWLIQREHPYFDNGTDHLQFWKKYHENLFVHDITRAVSDCIPPLVSGGILADDMGLGKTIQLISLIANDPERAVEDKLIKENTVPDRYRGRPTLIVAPVGLMSNWTEQISMHVSTTNQLRVIVYHGAKKNENINFNDYDVVVTSYGSLRSEFQTLPESLRDGTGVISERFQLFSQLWRRVILDEAHIIRNPASKISLAVVKLNSYSHWALTGTPIMNVVEDLFSLLRFFHISGGLNERKQFKKFFTMKRKRQNNNQNPDMTRLQALLTEFCLRRAKTMDSVVHLQLPPLNEHLLTIRWTPDERKVYDALRNQAQRVMEDYAANSGPGSGRSGYIHVLEALLRLRQMCNHRQLVAEKLEDLDFDNNDTTMTPEKEQQLRFLLQTAIENNDECDICFENLNDPLILPCQHIYCRYCIQAALERNPLCPKCRAPCNLSKTRIISTADLDVQPNIEEVDSSSTKIESLMRILSTTKAQNDAASFTEHPVKTVVFSQWTSFLNIIEPLLKDESISYTRIDGTMSADKRDEAILQFKSSHDCTVLLASLSASSTGLNLTVASQIVMCDLWWNTAQERQAIDRCYRLGQTRPVHVFRLVMEDSIEDKVIEIQTEKLKITEAALNDGQPPKRSKVERLRDIERLLASKDQRKQVLDPHRKKSLGNLTSETIDPDEDRMKRRALVLKRAATERKVLHAAITHRKDRSKDIKAYYDGSEDEHEDDFEDKTLGGFIVTGDDHSGSGENSDEADTVASSSIKRRRTAKSRAHGISTRSESDSEVLDDPLDWLDKFATSIAKGSQSSSDSLPYEASPSV